MVGHSVFLQSSFSVRPRNSMSLIPGKLASLKFQDFHNFRQMQKHQPLFKFNNFEIGFFEKKNKGSHGGDQISHGILGLLGNTRNACFF